MKYLSLLLLALFPFSLSVQAQSQNDPAVLHFSIIKPESWHFVHSNEDEGNQKEVLIEGAALADYLKSRSEKPLLVLSKYQEPYEDVNPVITISALAANTDSKGVQSKPILSGLIQNLKKRYVEAEVVEQPSDVVVDSMEGAYGRINYSYEAETGEHLPVSSQIWVVPANGYVLVISASTRQDESTGTREEVNQILARIKL